jgi:thioredoxin-related protein
MRKEDCKMFSFVLGTVLSLLLNDLNNSRTWESSYAKAIQDVQRTDKPLFIVFDKGSSSFRNMVHENPFLSEQVEEALSADYLRMFVDTETEAGKKLAGQFEADELPRIVVIDRSGEWQVYRKSGSPTSDQVQSVLAQYRRSKITTSPSTTDTRFYPPSSSSSTVTECRT